MASASCAICSQPDTNNSALLHCRECGYGVHSHCHLGLRVCPHCATPLVTAAVAQETAQALAKRRIEYRLTGLVVTGCFMMLSSGPVIASAGRQWGWWDWLSIPCGTLLLLGLSAAGAAVAGRFLKHPVRSRALAAALLFTLAAFLFVPGAYGVLMPWATSHRIAMLLAIAVAVSPLALVPLSWREFFRWKQTPGPSAGTGPDDRGSLFEATSDALGEMSTFTAKQMVRRR